MNEAVSRPSQWESLYPIHQSRIWNLTWKIDRRPSLNHGHPKESINAFDTWSLGCRTSSARTLVARHERYKTKIDTERIEWDNGRGLLARIVC
jgi:hypothetical protein